MRPAEARRLAIEHRLSELAEAAAALTEEREPPFRVEGADPGEKLTHVLLAQRIRERIDAGEDPREAFRAVMASVRAVVANE
jgi:uncharacterized protein (DUF2237 family)